MACVGVDLDNTIICYDRVLSIVAAEQALVSTDGGGVRGKHSVKTAIERLQGNDAWTALQGEIYGRRVGEAAPFPGVTDFFRECRARGIPTRIISHKTRYPALGPRYDLRQAAMMWLETNDWFGSGGLGLTRSDVEFHDTLAGKLGAIASRGCTIFIDDLPEVFTAPGFPGGISRVLFDPEGAHTPPPGTLRARSWSEIAKCVFGAAREQ